MTDRRTDKRYKKDDALIRRVTAWLKAKLIERELYKTKNQ